MPLSDKDILFGTHLLEKKDPAYRALLEQDLAFLNTLLRKFHRVKNPKL